MDPLHPQRRTMQLQLQLPRRFPLSKLQRGLPHIRSRVRPRVRPHICPRIRRDRSVRKYQLRRLHERPRVAVLKRHSVRPVAIHFRDRPRIVFLPLVALAHDALTLTERRITLACQLELVCCRYQPPPLHPLALYTVLLVPVIVCNFVRPIGIHMRHLSRVQMGVANDLAAAVEVHLHHPPHSNYISLLHPLKRRLSRPLLCAIQLQLPRRFHLSHLPRHLLLQLHCLS